MDCRGYDRRRHFEALASASEFFETEGKERVPRKVQRLSRCVLKNVGANHDVAACDVGIGRDLQARVAAGSHYFPHDLTNISTFQEQNYQMASARQN